MESIEIIGLIAGLCTSASVLPQLIKSLRTREVKDVSIFMFIVLMTGNSLWVFYGIRKSDIPIIATNCLALVLNIAMLILKIRYHRKAGPEKER